MEKGIWTEEVRELYRNKYIVMTNVRWRGTGDNVTIGDVYSLHDTHEEARKVKFSLDVPMETVFIVRGKKDEDDEYFLIGGVYGE